ncbi:DUF6705 family protein [Flavobacterium sp.]|uniref:DUF6705 family protein n=1 Tax=Flavobacterium sp. TaxID=239 RepID=UPI003750CC82
MKNIIKIITIIISLQLNAQTTTPVEQMMTFIRNNNEQNHYFKDVNGVFDKFIGNWKYETATEKVELLIVKVEMVNGQNYYEDVINILFKYTKNNVVIFDTISSNINYYIFGEGFWEIDNFNKHHFRYWEPNQDRFGIYQTVDIEYIPVNVGQPQLNWVAKYEPKDSYTASPPEMPMNMVFTKLP